MIDMNRHFIYNKIASKGAEERTTNAQAVAPSSRKGVMCNAIYFSYWKVYGEYHHPENASQKEQPPLWQVTVGCGRKPHHTTVI